MKSIICSILNSSTQAHIYYQFLMNMEFIQDGQLLSNETNLNLDIDFCEREDLGFFTSSVHQNQNLQPNQKQSVINPICQNQENHFNTLFQEILAKCSTETNASLQENNFWVDQNDILKVQNPIQLSYQIQSNKVLSKKLKKIKKRKTHFKTRNNRKTRRSQSSEAKRKRLELQSKLRSETKNIPKNYGKAIIGFILRNQNKVKNFPQYNSIKFQDLKKELKEIKRSIRTIADLRSLWVDCKHARLIRSMGNLFLRKHSLTYAFNSKIENKDAHIKYRSKLLRAIRDPESFQYMKGF